MDKEIMVSPWQAARPVNSAECVCFPGNLPPANACLKISDYEQ